MKLDLGSGPSVCEPSYVGVDLCGTVIVSEMKEGELKAGRENAVRAWAENGHRLVESWDDVKPGEIAKVDLREFPWPWPDNSVDIVWSAHLIQYFDRLEWVRFVDELYRILMPDGYAQIIWPNLRTGRAWQDPLFADHIPLERWSYSSKRWREQAGLQPHLPYPTCDLEVIEFKWEGVHDDFHARADDVKQYAAAHYWDVSADNVIIVRAVKDVPDVGNEEAE